MDAGLAEAAAQYARQRRRRRLIGYGVGMLGLLAATVIAATQRGSLQQAWDAIRAAPAATILAALALPVLSWLLTTGTFWTLTMRHAPVGFGEMSALMGSSWLLNFLPLKPGLAGRVAYHKTVHGIDVAKSMEVLAWAIVSGGLSIGAALLTVALVPASTGARGTIMAALAPLAGVGVILLLCLVAEPLRSSAWKVTALGFRYADLLVWSARYLVAFELVGSPVSVQQAVAIAGVSQLATLLPLVGNGLGVREWAVGLVASSLPAWFVGGTAENPGLAGGLTADLVNRAFELIIAVPLGLACIGWIAARLRNAGRSVETGISLTPNSGGEPSPANGHQTEDVMRPPHADSRAGLTTQKEP